MPALLLQLWHGLRVFVVDYPLVMAWAWMALALLYVLRREGPERWLPGPPASDAPQPPVSVLIPCFNEGETLADTLRHALALRWPELEVIGINDGSSDDTAAQLEAWARVEPRLRVVHLAANQGKAMALRTGALLARHELLVCIDGDALLDPDAVGWLVRHFQRDPGLGAVTGNPRIRNRTTLLGRVQVGEFAAIIGLIKRAQSSLGGLFTVSGVIAAFRRSALQDVGFWDTDMLTEDIAITWSLQRAGWRVAYEPHALVWILMPETLRGLWKQRLRWAEGGVQVLMAHGDLLLQPRRWRLWPFLLEPLLSLVWAQAVVLLVVGWLAVHLVSGTSPGALAAPLLPSAGAHLLGLTCLLQGAVSLWLDRPYDRGLARNGFWMVWYPAVFWLLTLGTSVVALPRVLRRGRGVRARWVSPDRGVRA
jgi:biofilm PGA synthesis N-glycosyltransferase PgaC